MQRNDEKLAQDLLRYGQILDDNKYEINGHSVRNRRILYAKDQALMLWSLSMIDGNIYRLVRIK